MAGTLQVNERAVWTPAGWIFNNVLERVALRLEVDDVKLGEHHADRSPRNREHRIEVERREQYERRPEQNGDRRARDVAVDRIGRRDEREGDEAEHRRVDEPCDDAERDRCALRPSRGER